MQHVTHTAPPVRHMRTSHIWLQLTSYTLCRSESHHSHKNKNNFFLWFSYSRRVALVSIFSQSGHIFFVRFFLIIFGDLNLYEWIQKYVWRAHSMADGWNEKRSGWFFVITFVCVCLRSYGFYAAWFNVRLGAAPHRTASHRIWLRGIVCEQKYVIKTMDNKIICVNLCLVRSFFCPVIVFIVSIEYSSKPFATKTGQIRIHTYPEQTN